MFTSRAEYRLLLREDNADLRLTAQGRELGLVDDVRWQAFETKRASITGLQETLKKKWIRAGSHEAQQVEHYWGKALLKEASLAELLRRPEVDIQHLLSFVEDGDSIDDAVVEQVEIQSKYEGYLARQQTDIDKALRYDSLKLPADFNYTEVSGLSNELVEKLQRQRPETLGQASRMQGMTPAAVSLLLVYLKKKTA
jgi:tRNA uridine 5-carboxymethylaminomethyl modification enzyme